MKSIVVGSGFGGIAADPAAQPAIPLKKCNKFYYKF